jgi:flavin reductase (DIM6/NTAB) family NADH-FMN oxidoreductase RutF
MSEFITIDPAQNSQQDNYKLLIGSVLPRPIAWISTQSKAGVLNLAPFSFYTGVCSNPPTLLFCPTVRGSDGAKKDTLLNIEETGEFVVNVVSEDVVRQMNQTAAEYPNGVDEFREVGLTPVASLVVQPPRVLESPLSMECRLQQIIPVGDGGLGSGNVVLGTIVQFHVQADLYHNGRIDTAGLKPVARLAGAAYCPVRDAFELERPALKV